MRKGTLGGEQPLCPFSVIPRLAWDLCVGLVQLCVDLTEVLLVPELKWKVVYSLSLPTVGKLRQSVVYIVRRHKRCPPTDDLQQFSQLRRVQRPILAQRWVSRGRSGGSQVPELLSHGAPPAGAYATSSAAVARIRRVSEPKYWLDAVPRVTLSRARETNSI